jgi:hypothetical protein
MRKCFSHREMIIKGIFPIKIGTGYVSNENQIITHEKEYG